ncbi:MAG: glycosyltransferase, partial [Victivallales bacterium]|nr:glycosyltransferase [Victivallales bacterium]
MNKNLKFAPIALFVYNRLDTLVQTIDALALNELASESDLFIFSDGARDEQAAKDVEAVRQYIKTLSGFKSIKIIEKEYNCGLAGSIIAGVTQLSKEFGKVIVLEDDLLTSPFFLRFMNDGLDMYQNNDEVISIHGYMYPVNKALPETFFLRGADCWGWATWERGWKLFESDPEKLLNRLKQEKLLKIFDMDGAYPYSKMLKGNILKKNNSWAIRWYASAFLENKLTLYPGRSLVANIGNNAEASHCTVDSKVFDVVLLQERSELKPIALKENVAARAEIIKYFRKLPFQLALAWLKGLI